MEKLISDLYDSLVAFGLLVMIGMGFLFIVFYVLRGIRQQEMRAPTDSLSAMTHWLGEAGRVPRQPYLPIERLVEMIGGQNGRACMRMLEDNRRLFETVQGSSHNHQNWPGGYIDHVTDGMNLAVTLYHAYSRLRRLPFALSDALLIFFLHDVEKPWKYELGPDGQLRNRDGLKTKDDAHAFRAAKLAEYGIVLTDEQQNGLRYVEGEMQEYSKTRRVMGPLAAFCHCVDVTGARIWFAYPSERDDAWIGADRRRTMH